MTMRVEIGFPPNYQAICDAFPHVPKTRGVVFAWDMIVYNPDGAQIPPSIMAHEEVHSLRQKGNPQAWWDKYLTDPAFRWTEEVPAHIIEYAAQYDANAGRNARRFYLNQIAERLAGPLYGRLSSKDAAIRLLKTGARTILRPEEQGVAA